VPLHAQHELVLGAGCSCHEVLSRALPVARI
jgi:hypothetical protein